MCFLGTIAIVDKSQRKIKVLSTPTFIMSSLAHAIVFIFGNTEFLLLLNVHL